MEMITKISGDKKSYALTGKVNEDETNNKKEESKASIRESFCSIYSINSFLRKNNNDKDKLQKND